MYALLGVFTTITVISQEVGVDGDRIRLDALLKAEDTYTRTLLEINLHWTLFYYLGSSAIIPENGIGIFGKWFLNYL